LAVLIDNPAGHEAGDQSKHDPTDERHEVPLMLRQS
jgi:hypothetical protein